MHFSPWNVHAAHSQLNHDSRLTMVTSMCCVARVQTDSAVQRLGWGTDARDEMARSWSESGISGASQERPSPVRARDPTAPAHDGACIGRRIIRWRASQPATAAESFVRVALALDSLARTHARSLLPSILQPRSGGSSSQQHSSVAITSPDHPRFLPRIGRGQAPADEAEQAAAAWVSSGLDGERAPSRNFPHPLLPFRFPPFRPRSCWLRISSRPSAPPLRGIPVLLARWTGVEWTWRSTRTRIVSFRRRQALGCLELVAHLLLLNRRSSIPIHPFRYGFLSFGWCLVVVVE
jgi:hypothetical protein